MLDSSNNLDTSTPENGKLLFFKVIFLKQFNWFEIDPNFYLNKKERERGREEIDKMKWEAISFSIREACLIDLNLSCDASFQTGDG